MTKQIKGSLDEIVEEIVKHLDESNLVVCRTENLLDENDDFIPMSDPVAGSYIRTALAKFVVEEEKCTGERDQNGSCKDCGKKSYHMIPTERKEESVEIHHHSTASVISIDMYQYEGGSEIFKSEMWMDYSVFEKLKEAIDAKANGELSFLFLTTPKKGGDDEA